MDQMIPHDKSIIVSGMPRSGTSMIMRMLQFAGLELLHDPTIKPDDANPHGYFEVRWVQEKINKLETDGKVIKVVSPYIDNLNLANNNHVIFVLRSLEDIDRSFKRLNIRWGMEEMQKTLTDSVDFLEANNIPTEYVNYDSICEEPEDNAEVISGFLDLDLDIGKMADAVDPGVSYISHKGVKPKPTKPASDGRIYQVVDWPFEKEKEKRDGFPYNRLGTR